MLGCSSPQRPDGLGYLVLFTSPTSDLRPGSWRLHLGQQQSAVRPLWVWGEGGGRAKPGKAVGRAKGGLIRTGKRKSKINTVRRQSVTTSRVDLCQQSPGKNHRPQTPSSPFLSLIFIGGSRPGSASFLPGHSLCTVGAERGKRRPRCCANAA